jgi:potassium-dependent mechanosensitive channel
VTDWWDSVRDQNEVLLIAFEAVLLWVVLTLAAWHSVHRLRRWRREGDPPFWRRASSAAGVILLRILPVVARAGKASGVQQRIIGRRRKLAGRLCGIA